MTAQETKKYLIVEYGWKTHKVYFSDKPLGRKSKWLHPQIEIRLISNDVKGVEKEQVNNAIMSMLYEHGYVISDLTYQKVIRKAKKVSEKQLSMFDMSPSEDS